MKKNDTRSLLIAVAIPLIVGLLAGFLTRSGMQQFDSLSKPPLSPPAWLFPVVWTILYVLMGLASYRISLLPPSAERTQALSFYVIQLFFNFVWSFLFFNQQRYFFAFIWLVALWLLIGLTMKYFYKLDQAAAWLLLPYLIWVSFAAYLNLAIAWIN